MTYLTPRDRDTLRVFRDLVAATVFPATVAEDFRSLGLVWQSSGLAIPVADGLAKVCLCRVMEPEGNEWGPPDDFWLAAVVAQAPTPAPAFAEDVPTIFELTCPEYFDCRLWITYFKPLPAHQQAWLFCAGGPQIGDLVDRSEETKIGFGSVVAYIDRIHPPLVRSELLECKLGPAAVTPEVEEYVFVNERYGPCSPQMYYEMLEDAGAASGDETGPAAPWAGAGTPPSLLPTPPKDLPKQPVFRWFDLWRRRSSLN